MSVVKAPQQALPAPIARRSPRQTHVPVFVGPAVLMLLLLLVFPLIQAFVLSFQVKGGWGFDNYLKAVTGDDLLRLAVSHTVVFSVVSTAAQYVIGLSIALLLNERIPARAPMRVAFLVPWMFPAVVPGIVWRWMLDGQYGIFNEILLRAGLVQEYVPWLADPGTALAGTIIANTWRGFPFMMVMLLAGLQSIPPELYEAAAVDGANPVRRFRHVTMPGLMGISYVVLLLGWINNFMNFSIVQIMTNGGPSNASEVLATRIYKSAFLYMEPAYAAAMGILLLVFLMMPGAAYVRATMRRQ